MSSRRLGGGRVLGSGKGLAPPPPASPANGARASSPFAPPSDAESTVSMHSRNSTQNSISPLSSSPLPDFSQDLTANISLAGPSNGAAASNELLCPICGDQMVCSRPTCLPLQQTALYRKQREMLISLPRSRCCSSIVTSTTPTKNSPKPSRTKSRHGSTNKSSRRSGSNLCP